MELAAFAPAISAAMSGARETDNLIRLVQPTVVRALAVSSATPHDDYVKFLKDLALSIGKKQVLALLIPALPTGLTTGFIGTLLNPLFGFIVGLVLEFAIRETEIGMFFLYIDLRTSAQGRDFEAAARANLDKQKNGSPEQKAKAEKELIDAFRAFVKFTN